jgi:hypothetical protein
MGQESQWKSVLRRVTFLPTAVLASSVTWFLVGLLNKIMVGMQGLDSDSFLSLAFIEFTFHAWMGAALLCVGAKIGPEPKATVLLAC